MRVLVTGATGYIGAAVAEALARAGHDVAGTARSDEAAAALETRDIEPVRAELRSPESLAEPARAADVVVHTAATQEDDMGPAERATTGVLLAAGTPLVFTSGVWVYGSAPPGEVLNEDSEPDPVRIYSWRPALEREVLDAGGIVVRPGMVYGRGGGPMNQFAEMAGADGTPRHVGDGTNHWSIVHVDDLAELYVLLVGDASPGSLFNGITGDPVEVRELAAAACEGAGAPAPVQWPRDEAAHELGYTMAEALTRDHRISGARAREQLGWRPPERSPLAELRQPVSS
jgi:nucleoside-diphosphate-sugar epimerase